MRGKEENNMFICFDRNKLCFLESCGGGRKEGMMMEDSISAASLLYLMEWKQ